VAGEGNEEMAMGGVTVGNRTGMVGTVAESQAADARFKGEEMAMGGVMVGDQTVMGSTGASSSGWVWRVLRGTRMPLITSLQSGVSAVFSTCLEDKT